MKVDRILSLMLIMAVILAVVSSALADTGTYHIVNQDVLVVVQDDGSAVISYNVTMAVDSGNIPWSTVGLPNSNYEILSWDGASASCRRNDGYGWTGARCDLDKTYMPGETFTYGLTARSLAMVYPSAGRAEFAFKPMWWDNAVTDKETVTIVVPKNVTNVTTILEGATFASGGIMTWTFNDIPPGAYKQAGFVTPDVAAFGAVEQPRTAPEGGSPSVDTSQQDGTVGTSFGGSWILDHFGTVIIIAGALFLILFFISMASGIKKDYDSPSLSFSGSSEKKRKLNMVCPNDGFILKKDSVKGTTIDVCEKCGGIYFDVGEIEKLVEAGVAEKDIQTQFFGRTIAKNAAIKAPAECMRCGEEVEKVTKTQTGTTATIYCCTECDGIWANNGTYQTIKDKRMEQEKANLTSPKYDPDRHASGNSWLMYYWFFYPHVRCTGDCSRQQVHSVAAIAAHSSSGGGSSGSSYTPSSCVSSCVSCACVASCACACACAGGGAAGCAPKDKIGSKYPQIDSVRLGDKKQAEAEQ
jgi:Zn-finger nucleic acid-binding protein